MPKVRRQYSGGAVATTLAAPVAASAVTTFNVAGGSAPAGWPSSAGVPFFVVLSPQTSVEEKMLVTLSGPTLTIVSRALDGTSAGSHASGASIYPVFTATDADEANELTSKYSTQGSIVHQGASTFTELTLGTAGLALKVNAGATAPEWGQVATAGIADSAITSAKIATGTITSGNIADGTIALTDLAASLQAYLCPVGTINAYAGTTAPTGWLLCNGAAFSSATYPSLYSVLNNVATTPDMRGLFPIGKTASSTGSTLLGTGGSTTIATTNLPSHSHANTAVLNSGTVSITDPGHAHSIDPHSHTNQVTTSASSGAHDNVTNYVAAGTNGASTSTGVASISSASTAANSNTTGISGSVGTAITMTNASTGSGTAYFQPFIAVNYIIKHD